MNTRPSTFLTLNNESFKNYLLLHYVSNATDPKWKGLNYISSDLILPEVWIQLHNYAKADVESRGGKLTGYEVLDKKFIKHNGIRSRAWPASWMWVISKKMI